VIYTGWKDDHVVLLELDPHPVVILAPNVEIALAPPNVPNLLILVQVLVEKHLNLILIHFAHLLWRDNDLITVLVAALFGDLVDTFQLRETVVEDANLSESFDIDGAARVVGQTLVALER
jgi:hypothetical protein